ncbi:MAG: GH116 family glycosyl-hydrolase, partial [Mycobacteriales bacterium]
MALTTRRAYQWLSVAGVIGGCFAAAPTFAGVPTLVAAHSPSRYFAVPAAAFSNKLGDFPAVADCGTQIGSSSQPDLPPTPVTGTGQVRLGPCPRGNQGTNAFQFEQPGAQPGLGVPLGGVGAGSFMVNQAGSFGPWDFGGNQENAGGSATQYEDRILPQAAFHVSEQAAGASRVTRTLAVNAAPWNQLPAAWDPLKRGQGTYSALWPFGWASYAPFHAGVSMRFWSPIVAGNDELSSMPVAYFDLRLANTTGKTDRIGAMFTMPNAPEHAAVTVRKGLSTRLQR